MKKLFTVFILLSISFLAMSQNVEVTGAIKIVDGSQGANKVLTSDANGLASWKATSAPSAKPYYQSVKICCISWMTKNLDVVTYRNGDTIPKVEDYSQWAALTTGAYCYYNNDSTTYAATYGKLYNSYAVNDARGLAPEGWHVPTEFELTTTLDCLGGASAASYNMKESEHKHWLDYNLYPDNLSGFTALPGGIRIENGFSQIRTLGAWYTSSARSATESVSFAMVYDTEQVSVGAFDRRNGLSVRCVKD